MAKGGESLGNEESSEEEEEVIPALNHTPGVRPLAPGVVFLHDILLKNFTEKPLLRACRRSVCAR
jgi:hypothetical protein